MNYKKIYWTDAGLAEIQYADLNAPPKVKTLLTRKDGLCNPYGLALDDVNGKIYWTDAAEIRYAGLNGPPVKPLLTSNGRCGSCALDDVNGKIYWTDVAEIWCADLNASPVKPPAKPLISNAWAHDIALDVADDKIYWTGSAEIRCAKLDGTQGKPFLTRNDGLCNPYGLALDDVNGKIYWTDVGLDGERVIPPRIQCADLNGPPVEPLICLIDKPSRLVLDVADDKIYWTDSVKIQSARLDGTQGKPFLTRNDGLCRPFSIGLVTTTSGTPSKAYID